MVKKNNCHSLHCLKFLHMSYRISEWGRIWGWRKRDGCISWMTQRRKKTSLQPGRGCETRRQAGEKRREHSSEGLLPPGWNMGKIHWGDHGEDLGARSVVKRAALREQWHCLSMLPSLMISLQLWIRSEKAQLPLSAWLSNICFHQQIFQSSKHFDMGLLSHSPCP